MRALNLEDWTDAVIKDDEITRYLEGGKDFIDDQAIERLIEENKNPDPRKVRDILDQSLALQRLEPAQTAALLNVEDEDLWQEMFKTGLTVKMRVYGPRVVTFAPLYVSNPCVNSCLYCGFRRENIAQKRRTLTLDEVRREAEAVIAIGHKRLIMVYGEHPVSDYRYIADSIRAVYETKVGHGEIRRVNINAAPQTIEHLKLWKEVGIGTFQVFQETYHHETYKKMHPRGPKSNFRWRLYALHRAQEAGVDDVAIGALFGLHDWKFEVMGLLNHAIDLEKKFNGVGPHTISFPRLEAAQNAPAAQKAPRRVSDRDFKRLVTVIRLSVPYTGMILTAREPAHIRREVMSVGCTQTDASTRIGIGAYSDVKPDQNEGRQQFMISDPRSLDEMVKEFTSMGWLTSFCTAGYRCGRTGSYFMSIAKKGKVHQFCIPNAILTFKEYLLDYASPETRAAGDKLIEEKIATLPDNMQASVKERLHDIENGKRDLYF